MRVGLLLPNTAMEAHMIVSEISLAGGLQLHETDMWINGVTQARRATRSLEYIENEVKSLRRPFYRAHIAGRSGFFRAPEEYINKEANKEHYGSGCNETKPTGGARQMQPPGDGDHAGTGPSEMASDDWRSDTTLVDNLEDSAPSPSLSKSSSWSEDWSAGAVGSESTLCTPESGEFIAIQAKDENIATFDSSLQNVLGTTKGTENIEEALTIQSTPSHTYSDDEGDIQNRTPEEYGIISPLRRLSAKCSHWRSCISRLMRGKYPTKAAEFSQSGLGLDNPIIRITTR